MAGSRANTDELHEDSDPTSKPWNPAKSSALSATHSPYDADHDESDKPDDDDLPVFPDDKSCSAGSACTFRLPLTERRDSAKATDHP